MPLAVESAPVPVFRSPRHWACAERFIENLSFVDLGRVGAWSGRNVLVREKAPKEVRLNLRSSPIMGTAVGNETIMVLSRRQRAESTVPEVQTYGTSGVAGEIRFQLPSLQGHFV